MAELRTNPSELRLAPGERQRLFPAVFDGDGRVVRGLVFTYISLDTAVARADGEGGVTGVEPGETRVVVQGGGVRADVPVSVGVSYRGTVVPVNPIPRLGIPSAAPLDIDTLILASGVLDTLADEETGRSMTWMSGDSAVLRVGPTGIVQAIGPGRTTLQAGIGLHSTRIPVIVHAPVRGLVVTPPAGREPVVLPLRGRAPFSAVALDASGNPVPEARIEWISGDASVIGFEQELGEARALGPGITTLIARSGPASVTWIVRVTEQPFGFSKSSLALLPGESAILNIRFGAAQGSRRDIAAWRTSNAAVAVPDSTGRIRIEGLGRATVTARSRSGGEATLIVHGVGDLLATAELDGIWRALEILSTRPDLRARLGGELPPVTEAVASPERARVLARTQADHGSILLADAHGASPTTVLTNAGTARGLAWFPSGDRAVVSVGDSVSQVWSIELDTGRSLRLTGGGSNSSPVVSPSGDLIAFLSTRDGEGHVYGMKPDGSDQVRLTRGEGPESGLAFLPDGSLVYARDPATGPWEVVRLPVGGTVPDILFRSAEPVLDLSVSRDGSMIAWLTGVGEAGRLHLMDLAGHHETLPLGPTTRVGRIAF